jgi:hypothetical protein
MKDNSWQQLLVQKHPHLFKRSLRGLPFSTGYPVCPDGWREAVTRMVERVSEAATGYSVYFRQISEERGHLWFYWNAKTALPKHVERTIEEAIELSEARSACTCATCGADARLFRLGGRLFTCCGEHARGAPVPVRPGAENLHLVRSYAGDDLLTIKCRRYDRDHDRFVDIDHAVVNWREILNADGGISTLKLVSRETN